MLGSTVRLVPRLVQRTGQIQPAQCARGMSTVTALKTTADKVSNNFRKLLASGVLSELRPPTPAEIPKAIGDLTRLFRSRNWKNVTVREAWLNTLVTTEVICWFFVGECIGKGSFIGYQV